MLLRRSIRERRHTIPYDYIDLIKVLERVKPISCKWIYKTKKDSKGNIERYKTCIITKGLTQKEGIDYKESFSPIDVKIAFLSGDIDETFYMVQHENFVSDDSNLWYAN
ncbi:hypothetical protein CR513_21197, partial [Mucuna pruriens]